MTESDGDGATAVVLDFLARGRTDTDRPRHKQSPLAYAVETSDFSLYELELDDDADITIGDRVTVGSDQTEGIKRVRAVEYEGLSGGAQSELEYVIEDLLEAEEKRFVDVYNEAGPITLRLHQLNLLPGIGKKLRNNILDTRKRKPFESYEDLEDRVSGLHDPKGILAERILEEIRGDDLKYRIFANAEE